jgi:hypothetical protein
MHGRADAVLLQAHQTVSDGSGPVVTALIVTVVLALAVFVALMAWWARPGGSDESGGGGSGGGGGGGHPPAPRPPEPSWWPEFENDFAEYVTSLRASGPAFREPNGQSSRPTTRFGSSALPAA